MTTERGHTLATEGVGAPAPSTTIAVPCTCPGKPHDQDTVRLAPAITNTTGMAAVNAVRLVLGNGGTFADALGSVASVYLHTAIEGWTKLDAEGKPEPLTPGNIDRLLPYSRGGRKVAEAADLLYNEELLAPLGEMFSTPSPGTSTDASTSAIPASGSTPPRPSRPSSPTSTDGKPSAVPVP